MLKTSGNLAVFLKQLQKGRFFDAFVVCLVFVIYKYSLLDFFLRYNFKKFKAKLFNQNKILVEGNKMRVNWQDLGLSKEIVAYGRREIFSTDYFKHSIKKEEILLDIGANIGYYTLIAAKKARKGKIYAVEPVKENIKVLKENIDLNDCKNCLIFALAISSRNAKSNIYVHEKKNWSSFNKLPGKSKKQLTRTMTLDKFIKNEINKVPSFIRMDVEGHELEILIGAKNTLKNAKKLRIMVEIHPHYLGDQNIDKFLDILEKNSFKIEKIILEVSPRLYHYRGLYNRYRRIFNILPFGPVDKKYYTYTKLSELLKKRNSIGSSIYFPQVIFEKI